MKHLFIINPAAGNKDSSEKVSAAIAGAFSGRSGDFEIYKTTGPMDAVNKIKFEADNCPELRVYACGGDGTLNECVCGAAGLENVAVTHFPTGTGNDFIKVFGKDAPRFSNIEELIEGDVHPVDLIDCNGRYSINICSVGIDARIGTDVTKYKSIPLIGGPTGYVTSLAVNFLKGIQRPMRVICDGRIYYGAMTLICACNGSFYGGGFNPVPEARIDDGLLDILVVKGVSRAAFLRVVGKYAKGKYADYPELITHIKTKSMEVDSEDEMVVNVDGEAMKAEKVHLRIIPAGVNFIVPKNTEYFSH